MKVPQPYFTGGNHKLFPPCQARIAATPAAPAATQSAALAGVTPPTATTGVVAPAAAWRSAARPSGGPKASLEGVGKMGPSSTKSAALFAISSAEWQLWPISSPGPI